MSTVMFQSPPVNRLCLTDYTCPPPPRLERASLSSHLQLNNVHRNNVARLPFDCSGNRSSSGRILKPRPIFGTERITFARLSQSLLHARKDQDIQEDSIHDAIVNSYAAIESERSDDAPDDSNDITAIEHNASNNAKTEGPVRRGSLVNVMDNMQRVSRFNRAA